VGVAGRRPTFAVAGVTDPGTPPLSSGEHPGE
jgi:hypothetical protein